ncbi:uncharacterized protein G2W53_029911 [Senna tora]|uniref:Uncharacterized protein n=1 Tax=Senna tora TaxID=362788 RepID=A0A834T8E8_9FABA|nr:uncharacterized protein G2W53_029911 [Senna tora]
MLRSDAKWVFVKVDLRASDLRCINQKKNLIIYLESKENQASRWIFSWIRDETEKAQEIEGQKK